MRQGVSPPLFQPISNEPAADPRANQKARTRTALITAALDLYRQGISPTVAQAAEHARVSRATAYRFFPTREALLVELSLTPAIAPVEDFLQELESDDVEERLGLLVEKFGRV